MSTLRKSCRNCASSKRHCSVQLPSCARCVQKGLACTYDLQPVSGGDETKCSASQLLGGSGFETMGYCLIDKAGVYNEVFGADLDPSVCPPGHQETQDLIEQCFLNVPELVVSLRPAVFIHPKLQLKGGKSYLSLIHHPIDSTASLEGLQVLAAVDFDALTLEEQLSALQTLLVFTAPLLVSPLPVKQDKAEPWLIIAQRWATHLYNMSSPDSLGTRTPWQGWLLAESIRRTIVMSYVLICCFNAWKYGYCSNWLFLESLPFDSRPGVWMAETPQAWIAAAGKATGKEVGTELTSVHEFGVRMKSVDSTFCGDRFLSMIAMAHNGSAVPGGVDSH